MWNNIFSEWSSNVAEICNEIGFDRRTDRSIQLSEHVQTKVRNGLFVLAGHIKLYNFLRNFGTRETNNEKSRYFRDCRRQ